MTAAAAAKTLAVMNDDEETNLKEALLKQPYSEEEGESSSASSTKEMNDFAHWSPWKKVIVVMAIMYGNCVTLWCVMPRVLEPANQGVLLPLASTQLWTLEEQEQAELSPAMDFEIVKMDDVLADPNNNWSTAKLQGPIPPIHPHHTASVTYSSQMGPDGSVQYRRDINAPCEFGMLIFSVGPAKDELPYTYELYNDAYLYSDNNGLCVFYPSYNGYQTSSVPLQNPTDPQQVVFKSLDQSVMHWISSRVFDPHRSKKKWDRTKVGDYAIIAKHNFYVPGFYKALKAEINAW
eukprot:CAMPEP_0113641660 /NCGR_PEP_ID=MMETSP0017_2-20120614/21875_1 /TAXON_ID=2856 /ORGANISM="Cylindrotheca closterium" /LENGTH=291 /DNA_ID=CAMNT_0000553023 /DNA_START=78 /DNA_END=950 /DNA_ORIENTATION=- /assembly_acc=CAM_ASM_000147